MILSHRNTHLTTIEKLPGFKEASTAPALKKKWKDIPSQGQQEAYMNPLNHLLTDDSTVVDAIIHLSPNRPEFLYKTKDKSLNTRYPWILEEVQRLSSESGKELLQHHCTQQLRQKLSQAIESFSPGFNWQWHDKFKPHCTSHDDQNQPSLEDKEDKGKGLAGVAEAEALKQIMDVEWVKEIIHTTPSLGPEVEKLFGATIKVIICYNFANID